MGFAFGFSAFNTMFFLVFAIVIGVFIVRLIKGLSTWNKNNHSPRLTVEAAVVSKRQNTDVHHHHNNDHMHTSTSTQYYATFQFGGGDRLELRLSGQEYGLLAEGDVGELTFQGTRYLDFRRRSETYTAPNEERRYESGERKSWDPEL